MINRGVSKLISEQGHRDLLMVTDAGFATPKGVEVTDLSLSENTPMVLDVLRELKKYYSVEKVILAQETKDTNPTHFKAVSTVWGEDIEVEVVSHLELKEISKSVKGIVRTGDFTAFGNIILVSGAGDRWYSER